MIDMDDFKFPYWKNNCRARLFSIYVGIKETIGWRKN